MQKYTAIFIFILMLSGLKAQTGRISGVIVDSKTGETLPGATIFIEGTQRGASADFDGKFSINNVPAGKVILVVNYISYTTKKIADVAVKANDVTDVNIQLDPSGSGDLAEVEVVVTLNKENNTALVLQQKNATSVSDGISAETIKRTPDRNTSDVLKRVSGVTIQDDKFVVVRGLNERYNASYLNNSPLPSTEPDKKAFAFDLFPANMLDNIVVNKTATPDMPSEFAGGIVQVNTKSIPEKNFVSFNGSIGYNTITTGKDKVIYEGGKLDKLGFDDGSRDIPGGVPALEDRLTWSSTPDQARIAKEFKNDWAYSKSKFTPNAGAQFATGYNFKRKERDFLGVIFSLGYNNTQNLYNLTRTDYDELRSVANGPEKQAADENYVNKVNQTQTSTGALLNLACKLNDNNSISLKNLLSGSADNKFITSTGSNNLREDLVSYDRINTRYFSANRIFSSQLNTEHLVPVAKLKIAFNAAYSAIQRTVPDMRFTSYSKLIDQFYNPSEPNPKDTTYKANVANSSSTGPNYAGFRAYSKLNERIISSKLDVSRLVKVNEKLKIDFKIGGLYQDRARQFDIRRFGLQQYSSFAGQPVFFADSLLYLPEDQIFSAQNIGVTPDGAGGFKAVEDTRNDDNYYATSKLYAGYGMGEVKITDKIRVIAGVRYESYAQELLVKYPKANGVNHDSIYVKNTVNDLLPSLNFIYNISEKLGVRLAYYKTLNRAEFRELSAANWYDPETRLSNAGNPDLVRCTIQNFDARFEIYPGRGQLFTVSGFYKHFENPIERYLLANTVSQVYYKNANFANVYGGEMEYRINIGAILKKDSIKFLNNLSLFSNLSLIKSEVNVKGLDEKVPDTRPMQGQAPYIINAGLSYIDNEKDFSFTAMVNRVGQRIYIVGNNLIPNRWEKPRTVVDLQATKSFFKNKLELRFNIKDLLHQDWIIYYMVTDRKNTAYNPDKDYLNFQRNFGTIYSFVVTYKF